MLNKKLIALTLLSSVSLFAVNRIDDTRTTQQPVQQQEDAKQVVTPQGITDTRQKQDPVSEPNIRYSKDLEQYSILEHDKKYFKSFIDEKGLPAKAVLNMYHVINDTESLALTSFAYDYGYGRPDFANAYYEKLVDRKDVPFIYKLRYADFLLRTGRVDAIDTNIKKVDCIVNFKVSSQCFYYLGVSEFIRTGNNKNSYLRISKDSLPQAAQIWNGISKK